MKLIKPSFEIIEQKCVAPNKMDSSILTKNQELLDGVYKQIELAGRTCYKSEDKITEDSAKEFVDRMIKSGHGAMLEHGTVYIYFQYSGPLADPNYLKFANIYHKYLKNKYSKVNYITPDHFLHKAYVTTNLRVLVENNWMDDLQYLCEPTEYHEKRITVRFICDRGVSHEFVRHRVFSFAQESTRYCNYSKDKFGNEITFIIPCWYDWKEGVAHINDYGKYGNFSEDSQAYLASLIGAEMSYFKLINAGWKPQQARAVLPNSLKTELVMTGFISDWEHFFSLRCAESAHPQARELAIPLKEEFIKRRYIKN